MGNTAGKLAHIQKRFVHEQLNQSIEQYGWIATGVPGKAIYTVGLIDKFGQPELMIHGMNPAQSHAILSRAVDLMELGSEFAADQTRLDIANGYPAKLIAVDPSNYHDWLGQMYDYHGPDTKALQILWCDLDSQFPGDHSYDAVKFPQLRFDVRRPEYEQASPHNHSGHNCAVCGNDA